MIARMETREDQSRNKGLVNQENSEKKERKKHSRFSIMITLILESMDVNVLLFQFQYTV